MTREYTSLSNSASGTDSVAFSNLQRDSTVAEFKTALDGVSSERSHRPRPSPPID
jgi:hypothetical protein